MTIYYLCPGSPETLSGGTRKLYDHVAILSDNGFEAKIVYNDDLVNGLPYTPRDLMVVPEVYGDGLRDFVPSGVRRAVFVQNPFLINRYGVANLDNHAYMTTPELVAVFTESELSTQKVKEQFPDLPVPIYRTHSSGNGRNGKDAGFYYSPWPREKRVIFFGYKHEHLNPQVIDGLEMPDGWEALSLSGMRDREIAYQMRTSAIFMATNFEEGMCAPTSEAIISGCVNVCWTGQGPDEYLVGRAVVAEQDNIEELRKALVATAEDIDRDPAKWAADTKRWSDWFQATYSRQAEIDEICLIMDELHGR